MSRPPPSRPGTTLTTRTPDRRAVLHGLAALAAVPQAAAASPASAFVALGDWGRGGGRRQAQVATAMAGVAAAAGSRFVVSAGDNFYPNGVASAGDPQWKSSFEEVYAAPALQTPWY